MKLRKDLKDTWSREQKKLAECKAAMKASKTKYTMLGQDLARVSSSLLCMLSAVSVYVCVTMQTLFAMLTKIFIT